MARVQNRHGAFSMKISVRPCLNEAFFGYGYGYGYGYVAAVAMLEV